MIAGAAIATAGAAAVGRGIAVVVVAGHGARRPRRELEGTEWDHNNDAL